MPKSYKKSKITKKYTNTKKSKKHIKKNIKNQNKRKTNKSNQRGGTDPSPGDGNSGYATAYEVLPSSSQPNYSVPEFNSSSSSSPSLLPSSLSKEQQIIINARNTRQNGDNFSSAHVREQKRINKLEKDCKERELELSQNNNGNWECITPNTDSSNLRSVGVSAKPVENIFGELGPPPPPIVPFVDRCEEFGKEWGQKSNGTWGCVFGKKSSSEKCLEKGKVYGETQNGNWGCIDNKFQSHA